MEIKNLNEVCMINMGQSPDSSSYNDKKEGLAFYQGNADFGEIHPTTRVWCNNPIKIAEKDDILISVRAPIGSMNIANEKCCIGRGLASIKPIDKNECNQNYLYYFLESKVPYMQSKGTGSTFKAINKRILTSLQIKLPNIREQEKFSSIISKIKAQIHNKKLQIRKYDELVKSQFIEMFGDPIANNKQWIKNVLGNECLVINGRAYSAPELLTQGKYRVLRVGNFFTNDKWYYSDLELPNDKYCDNGDLLFAWSASFGPKIWDGEKVIYHYHIWKLDKYQKHLNRDFFYELLIQMTTELKKNKHGSTMSHFTKSDMEKLEIIVPPIELQNQFADFVKHIDKLKFTIKKSIDKLELCYKSLMKQYFD